MGEAPRAERFPVEVPVTIHWADMDALGHVNNARYFTWFESARMELFARVGLAATGAPEVGPILAHTRCDFLAPLVWGDEIVSATRIASLGNSSFVMHYQVVRHGSRDGGALAEPQVVARGEGVVVLVNYERGGKVPIPEALRARLEALK